MLAATRGFRGVIGHIIPQYDEVALFSMSFTFILLITTGIISSRNDIQLDFSAVYDVRAIVIILVLLSGPVLSIYHAFTDRSKTSLEKHLMLIFAVIINAFSGIYAGSYALEITNGWLIIFPIVNIANGAILLMLLREGVLTESSISDQNASRGQILLAALAIVIIFSLCHYVFALMWMQTFSICVAYATNLSRVVHSLVSSIMQKSNSQSQFGSS